MDYSRSSDLMGTVSNPIGSVELDRLQEQIDQLRCRLPSDENSSTTGELDVSVALALVREILRTRRRRNSVFGGDLFGEPAWDLLLELYAAELSQCRVSISGACIASAVPPTTALRWIDKLEKDGWLGRESDPLDGRRSWTFLTPQGVSAMRNYLAEIGVRPTQ